MGTFYGSRPIVTDGLGLFLDASNPKSYPGTGDEWYDLSGNNFHMKLNGSASQSLASASNDSFFKYFDLDGVAGTYGECDGSISNSVACTPANFVSDNDSRSVVSLVQVNTDPTGSLSGGVYDYGDFGLKGRHYCLRLTGTTTGWRAQQWGTPDYDFTYDTTTKFTMFSMGYGLSNIGKTYRDNGILLGQDLQQEELVTAGSRPFEMGRYRGTNYFGGKIGLLMFYTKELTPEELAQNYYALRNRWEI
jgi:hypothetical protein